MGKPKVEQVLAELQGLDDEKREAVGALLGIVVGTLLRPFFTRLYIKRLTRIDVGLRGAMALHGLIRMTGYLHEDGRRFSRKAGAKAEEAGEILKADT